MADPTFVPHGGDSNPSSTLYHSSFVQMILHSSYKERVRMEEDVEAALSDRKNKPSGSYKRKDCQVWSRIHSS